MLSHTRPAGRKVSRTDVPALFPSPQQNNLTELYALLSFILPHVFNDQDLFESQFDFSEITTSDGSKLSEQEEVTLLVAQLQNILKPFLLRRCKKDVIKDLPLKKEYVHVYPTSKGILGLIVFSSQVCPDRAAHGAPEGDDRGGSQVSLQRRLASEPVD